jgi:predicted ATPase
VDAALDVVEPGGQPQQADLVLRRKALADRLSALADKSLLVAEPDPGGGTRYRMLETILAYAAARLAETGQADTVRARHAAHYASFAERSAIALTGPEQATWAARVDCEYQNVRAAFTYGNLEIAVRVCLGLWRFWRNGGHIGEGREWLDRVLSRPSELGDQRAAQLLYGAAVLAAIQDDH